MQWSLPRVSSVLIQSACLMFLVRVRSGQVSLLTELPIRVGWTGSLWKVMPSVEMSSSSFLPGFSSLWYPQSLHGALKSPTIRRGSRPATFSAGLKMSAKVVSLGLGGQQMFNTSTDGSVRFRGSTVTITYEYSMAHSVGDRVPARCTISVSRMQVNESRWKAL